MNPDIESLKSDLAAGRIERRAALKLALAAGVTLAACGELLAAAAAPSRVRSTRTIAPLKRRVDYIVVGSGTAGCVLANRLSADPGVNVVVLEGGVWAGTNAGIDAPGG